MKISKVGINLIKEFEGCRLKAYVCSGGKWTIGFGETNPIDGVPIHAGMKITQEKAEQLLAANLEKRYEPAVRNLGVELNQNQYDALVSFCYNLGPYIFKGRLLETIKAKNWQSVADQLLLYNKAGGKELKGLTRRRKAEAELFLKPCKEEEKEMVKQTKIVLNGVEKTVSAINVDGTNFVKLRDLEDARISIGYANGKPTVTSK